MLKIVRKKPIEKQSTYLDTSIPNKEESWFINKLKKPKWYLKDPTEDKVYSKLVNSIKHFGYGIIWTF